MKGRRNYFKYLCVLLLPLGLLLNYFSSLNGHLTEKVYSNALYKRIAGVVSGITGLFPLSVAELALVLLLLFTLWRIGVFGVRLVKSAGRRIEIARNALVNLLAFAGVFYFTFVVMWGFNYNRMPLSHMLGLEVKPASVEELAGLCRYLAREANELRSRVREDPRGVMQPEGGLDGVFERASSGFDKAAGIYPELGGTFGKPKPVLLSVPMSYLGIWGVYCPFTSEANVNTLVPTPFLLSSTCHEMAHQRGIAREDEANYAAYLACTMNPDYDFRYSGMLLALNSSMNALYGQDRDIYRELVQLLDDGIKRDLEETRRLNRKYDGPTSKAFSKYNDLYLKANRQSDGERSYGRVVDLLIAEYRMRQEQGQE